MKWRYVEITYKLPGSGEHDYQFRAGVVKASTPGAAFGMVRDGLRRAHRDATHCEEFMQRILTEDQAEKITAAMTEDTWEGWKF